MEIVIEPAGSEREMAAIHRVRQQVFAHEMGIDLPRLTTDHINALHLLARRENGGEVVAALSVIETSGDDALHQRYGLDFPPGASAARYTQLAVLRPFRGLNLPLKLILEAHRRFVAPGSFGYTWLLFDAERAASSNLCRWLAFIPGAQIYLTEYGRSCALVRDERATQAQAAVWRARDFAQQASLAYAPISPALARPTSVRM